MSAEMARPDAAALLAAMEPTWPAAARHHIGPWLLREAPGAGRRAGCATAEGPVTPADLAVLEDKARALGQDPLVMIRPGDEALDAVLAAAGWRVADPVVLYLAPAADLAAGAKPFTAFPIWPPLAIQEDFWQATGIGPERRAVMARAAQPKAALLARNVDRPGGVAFVAVSGGIGFVHALAVLPAQRRQGSAYHMMLHAAVFAQAHGADWLALAVSAANAPARNLYASLKMEVVGQYHYRIK